MSSRKRCRCNAPRAEEGRRRPARSVRSGRGDRAPRAPSYDADGIHRLAAEAVLGRIGDAAKKLTTEFGDELPRSIPWAQIVGLRIIVDHAYHKIDYDIVWATLERDVPELRAAVLAWGRKRDLVPAFFLESDQPEPPAG